MRVGDLLEILEQIAEEDGEDTRVFFMGQPNWPFEYSISGVIQRREIESEEDDDERVHQVNGTESRDVFLVEGTQVRYGSKKAWDR